MKLTNNETPAAGLQLSDSSWALLAFTRFFLASVVLIRHLKDFGPMPLAFQKIMMLGGRASVLGFLLISGLSIGHSYRSSKNGYFTRRFLRIYPLYITAILVAMYLQYFLGSPFALPVRTMQAAGLFTSIANFFFLQGFASITITYNEPLWSLSVEVFFYLLVPLLIKSSTRLQFVFITVSMLWFMLTGIITSLQLIWLWGASALAYGWPWLLGFLISGGLRLKYIIPFFVAGIAIIIGNKTVMAEPLSWLTYAIAASILLICIYNLIQIPVRVRRILNYFGEISYPLYLFHMPFFLLFYYLGVRNGWAFFLLSLLCVIPINFIVDYWLKRVFWKPLVKWVHARFVNNRFKITKSAKRLLLLAGK